MATQLITKNVWREITNAAKSTRSISIVAVAYFGKGGSRMLPLKKGSLLLVDASEKAVKSGQTCPEELLKLYKKDVLIFSLPDLHSKVFVIGNNLFIGSANVSSHSAFKLNEALYKTSDKKSVEKAKEYVKSYCKEDLGEKDLRRLQKLYRPPKLWNTKNIKSTKPKKNEQTHSFLTYQLDQYDYSDEEEIQSQKGRNAAVRKRIKKSRHVLDEFTVDNNLTAKIGDIILQIVKENNEIYVSPPGRLIHIRKWRKGKKVSYFCFVEIRDVKRKNIKWINKKLNPSEKKELKRSGKRSKAFEEKMYSLWPSY